MARKHTDQISSADDGVRRARHPGADRQSAKALISEVEQLTELTHRLTARTISAELAVDAAMQGVRQLLGLDEEIHAEILQMVDSFIDRFPAIAGKLALHNAIASAIKEDADGLVGTAAFMRSETAALLGTIERLSLLADADN